MKAATKAAWSATGPAFLATTLKLGSTSLASAQQIDGQRLSIEPRAGIAIPAGDLSDVADVGPGIGLGLAYRLTDRLAVRIDGDVGPGDRRRRHDDSIGTAHAVS